VNALADSVGAPVAYADFGLVSPVGDQSYKVGDGTADIALCDAMTQVQAKRAIRLGARFADDHLAAAGIVAVGEIGVGNTTTTAALAARILGVSARDTVGPGAGLAPAAMARKAARVEAALTRVRDVPDDPLQLLAALGGFEIAGNVGVILRAAAHRQVTVIDGAITALSALVAVRLCPAVAGYLIAAHLSTEPVHGLLLAELRQAPLLDLRMHLGMASGAVLALGLVKGALLIDASVPRAGAVGLAGAS
jgi:nicotinate-nucleotide--dimethylbenzimidazole phosphoribosyltransferase